MEVLVQIKKMQNSYILQKQELNLKLKSRPPACLLKQ